MEIKLYYKAEGQEIVHVHTGADNHYRLDKRYPEYTAQLRQIQRIKLANECDYSWCELRDPYNKSWLTDLANMGFHMAVVWYDGSWPESQELETRLIEWYNDTAAGSWLVAGQLIHHPNKDDYPHFYPGCVVVNLKEYLRAGSPRCLGWDKPENRTQPYKLSGSNIHDDYTPTYIIADDSPDVKRFRGTVPAEYLDHLINNSLALGYTVHNLPQGVRDNKHSCYPEDDVEQTIKWLLDPDFNTGKTALQAKEFGYTLPEDKMELYGYKNQQFQVLYVTNTENIPSRDPELDNVKFTQHVVPCAGLHQFWHVFRDLDTLKHVVWYDYNPYAVKWMRWVLEYWNGEDFSKFFSENIDIVCGDGVIARDCIIYDPCLWERLLKEEGGSKRFREKWDKLKQLRHTFLECDVVQRWETLTEQLDLNSNLFIQLTNIWQYESNYLNTKPFIAQINFLLLFKHLMGSQRAVYFKGNTPGGQHYNYENMRLHWEID